jgi:tRNA pseudouridine55 synthase
MDGILIFDKPNGISSHGAVQYLRRLTGIRRIGHLGTLDPLGTGVLPMIVGRATRLARFFTHKERVYESVIRFGFSTDSYDADGKPTSEITAVEVNQNQLESLLPQFRGRLMQLPPPISAKKIDGVRAYKLARKKQPVPLKPVEIEVYQFDLLSTQSGRAHVRVRCSAGTYLRSLAHDLGRELGVGAHVQSLRRLAMGEFTIQDAYTVENLEQLRDENRLSEALLKPSTLLPDLPMERVDAATAIRITHGCDFRVSAFSEGKGSTLLKAIAPDGRLIAIAEARLPLLYHPIVVL